MVMPSSLWPAIAGYERRGEAGIGGTTLGPAPWGMLGGVDTTGDGPGIRRGGLAEFLRARRARLRPADVGLPDGTRRRTPGLRRQEVAQLAGMSVDYYIRLEQARGPRPSRQVLSALSRALMLTRDEREYLFRIAGESPPVVAGPDRELTPAMRYLLDGLAQTPAYVVDAKYDVLAWNRLATYFIGDFSEVAESDRNIIRWIFRQPDTDRHWDEADTLRFARSTVADLRAAYARYPGDRSIEALVTELLGVSSRFAEMWGSQEVEVRRRIVKRVAHPLTGPLEFECQVLHVPDADQRLIVYCAEPGSPTQEAFRRLADRAPASESEPTYG
jgi:transcriptional regulator with XRE-family HTH domain